MAKRPNVETSNRSHGAHLAHQPHQLTTFSQSRLLVCAFAGGQQKPATSKHHCPFWLAKLEAASTRPPSSRISSILICISGWQRAAKLSARKASLCGRKARPKSSSWRANGAKSASSGAKSVIVQAAGRPLASAGPAPQDKAPTKRAPNPASPPGRQTVSRVAQLNAAAFSPNGQMHKCTNTPPRRLEKHSPSTMGAQSALFWTVSDKWAPLLLVLVHCRQQ